MQFNAQLDVDLVVLEAEDEVTCLISRTALPCERQDVGLLEPAEGVAMEDQGLIIIRQRTLSNVVDAALDCASEGIVGSGENSTGAHRFRRAHQSGPVIRAIVGPDAFTQVEAYGVLRVTSPTEIVDPYFEIRKRPTEVSDDEIEVRNPI